MTHLLDRKRFGLFYTALCIFAVMFLSACDNGTDSSELTADETGSIAFKVVYDEEDAEGQIVTRNESEFLRMMERILSPASVIADSQTEFQEGCYKDNSTLEVEAIVYDENNEEIAYGGPWNCSKNQEDREGKIENVLVGINRKIVLLAKEKDNDEKVYLFRSEKTGITVKSGETTEVPINGPVSFAPVPFAPVTTDNKLPMRWNMLEVAVNYWVEIKDTTDGKTIPYLAKNMPENNDPSVFQYQPVIALSSSYVYRVLAEDIYGNRGGYGKWISFDTDYTDKDHDGYTEDKGDCNDDDPAINPGATEIPDNDIDENCDGKKMFTWYKDHDGDGYSDSANTQSENQPGADYKKLSDFVKDNKSPEYAAYKDCNDNDPAINPGASEIPDDGIDQNCDGKDTKTWYKDADGDGYSDGNKKFSTEKLEGYFESSGLKSRTGDCDDTNSSVYPGATEICYDGMDNDCDGLADSADPDCCTPEICYDSRDNDCDGLTDSADPDCCTAEICYDGRDNDCDGKIDAEDSDCCADADGDGHYGKTTNCPSGTDCNDSNKAVYPGATEICNDGVDNDCNTETAICECTDADGDGHYAVSATCSGSDDCNDSNKAVYPGATEICSDEIDNDCDGNADATDSDCTAWYKDSDGDGYSDGTSSQATEQPSGYVEALKLKAISGDCNDDNPDINPGVTDIPGDGIDQNCDGNDPPVANAGEDQTDPHVGDTVTLDGSASYDRNRDTLTYKWSFASKPDGSKAVLPSESLDKPTFSPDAVGDYEVQLIVNDGKADSNPDSVKITVLDRKIYFSDANLRQAIAETLRITTIPSDQDGSYFPESALLKLTSLDADGRSIENISGLEYCRNLTELHLGSRTVTDYRAIYKNSITDLKPIENLTNLELLFLDVNQLDDSDLVHLKKLTRLRWLGLGGNQISDISPLANLKELTWLDLSANQISDISPLANLKELTLLGLNANQIGNISPLSMLIQLEALYLDDNQISDISPLSNLKSLTEIFLDNNQISDIGTLSNLKALTSLQLYNNQISDISPLAGLINLEHLGLGIKTNPDVDSNQISDITPLTKLTKLIQLFLSGLKISDISPLANASLPDLTELDLDYNQISDISPLATANLPALTELDLYNNRISDISPLTKLTKLTRLILNANPLSTESCNTYIPRLKGWVTALSYDCPATR